MTPTMKRFSCMKALPVFILACWLPANLSAKDLGMFNGQPTPALAMYAAQVSFATERCVSEGLVEDAKAAASLMKYFGRGITLGYYMKKDDEFVTNFTTMKDNYSAAWSESGTENRRLFCDGLARDLAARKEQGWLRWNMPLNYFRYHFSPPSEASAKRAKKFAMIASVAGAALTTAAGVSAGLDAVSSAKAGDWATSNQQMAASRSFNQAGSAIAGMTAASDSGAGDSVLRSVQDVKAPDGTMTVVRCPVIDHFYRYSAPIDSAVWTTYQSVSMVCREPVAADFQLME